MSKGGSGLPAISPQVAQKLAENQTRELQIRAEELQLKKQQDNHNFSYAQEVLKAQAKDREQERAAKTLERKHRFVFVGLVFVLSLIFLGYLVSIDKEQIALELLKVAVYGGTGLVAGFYAGRLKKPDNDDP